MNHSFCLFVHLNHKLNFLIYLYDHQLVAVVKFCLWPRRWPGERPRDLRPGCGLARVDEAGTKMSTFAHRGHRGAPSHALGTHQHQSRFHRHFRGTFGHFRGNFSDFQGQKPENRGKSGTPENNCPTPRFTADCFAWGSRRQKIYGTRRWRDFKIFRI